MQISENLLRVIFMLSTIIVVTDCCSSRLLLLKEHTLQIVQQQRLHHSQSDDYDYEHDDYEQLQQQQHQQQQQQQQKLPHYVELAKSDIDYIKNYTDEHTRSKNKDGHEENSTEADIFSAAMQLGNFDSDSFESLLGIFDAAAFDTTTTTTATTTEMSTTSLSSAIPHSTTTSATTIDQQSTSPESAISTTQRARTSAVVDEQQNVEASSTTMPTPASTTIASSLGDDMEKVMNDLKTVRDLLSLPCSGQFNTEFCLNRGRCFRYPIGNDTIHSCICADGYIGERCESKSMNGSFIPSIAGAGKKQKILMARIVFSFPMLVALSVIYIMVGAAIVFKRPVPPPHTMKERIELLPDDDAGELILLNSYPVVDQTVTYASFMD
ncbi:protein gurken [Bactrocera dorsalis]|uniref:Protein gurken n=1 Tax=Bactrocera dorsalis TaxID=27457 RepID=A0A6I9VNV4_BACDO|nr:protein gurken [Bactrocera dorsalis]